MSNINTFTVTPHADMCITRLPNGKKEYIIEYSGGDDGS